MSYLMEVSIGPVQSFIASARRTRDFWFGSKLVSELSKAAALAIVTTDKTARLVFPFAANEDLQPWSALSVANNIIAVVDGDPQSIGEQAKKDVLEFAKDILTKAAEENKIENLFIERGSEFAHQQLHDGIEVIWAAVPFTGSNHDYSDARKNLAIVMSMRKATRTFSQPNWVSDMVASTSKNRQENDLIKSSLDGQREAVLHVPSKTSKTVIPETVDFKPGEHLSGIDLLKRLGRSSREKDRKFASTSHMAAMPLLQRIETISNSHELNEKWDAYCKVLPKRMQEYEKVHADEHTQKRFVGNIDGSLFFPERALDYLSKDEMSVMRKIQQQYQLFFKKLQETEPGIQHPQPYYAFLRADGDSMGAAIVSIADLENHQQFSRALSDFASDASIIIKDHAGAPIFTGGDDVVAMLPLHTSITCANAIQKCFKVTMERFQQKNNITWDTMPTLSAGLQIAHHLEPLTEVFAMAGKAEKMAKRYDDAAGKKNALAILISKRSGGDTIAVGHWNALVPRLERLIVMARQDLIPSGVSYELRQLSTEFSSDTANRIEMEKAEVIRILKRKKMSKANIDEIQSMYNQYQPRKSYPSSEYEHFSPTAQLANELIIAQFIAQAMNLAGLEAAQ